MQNVNEEMRATADFAINSAKQRYGLELNYSEESLEVLDNILEKIYWEHFNQTSEVKESSLVYNIAIIWGAFLGEYICLKWGGTWIFNGNYRYISITGIEVSPITFVYQKITDHPEYHVENFINETKKLIYASVIHPTKSQYLPEGSGQPKKKIRTKQPRKPISIDKRFVYGLAGLFGMLIIFGACMAGNRIIQSSSLGGVGLFASLLRTHTATSTPTFTASFTPAYSRTPTPTVTQLPTYTPRPTNTQRPSPTPSRTFTQLASLTPTVTLTTTSTKTLIPYRSPTPTIDHHNPPSKPQPPTVPPVTIESCEVFPSTVQPGVDEALTFVVQFSAPGYEFSVASFNPSGFPGQSGCSGTDTDGDRIASCDGASGMLPDYTEVKVTLNSSVGSCSVKYNSK